MSYVSQQFLLCDNSSVANFKNWGQAISSALSSSGWTQTADTGQVNWSTIASAPTAGNFVYEIWQPADALQTGSTAYYLKIKYGSNSATGPRLQIQIGAGTDGLGALTGITSTNFEPSTSTNPAAQGATTFDCYFSGDTDRFCAMMWRSSALAAHMWGIERTKQTDGTNLSDGVNIVVMSESSSALAAAQQTIVFGASAGNSTATRSYVALTNNSNASDAFNNNIPVSPLFPVYGKYGNPMTIFATVHTQDVSEACLFSSTLYGSTRTYIATAQMSISSPANMKMCMRYD